MKKLLLIITLLSSVVAVQAQDTLRGLVFSAMLDTTQQDTPTVNSSARGIAGFYFNNDSLMFDITVNGLSGEIMEAGIHSGEDSILISLDDFIDRNSIRGILSDIEMNDSLMLHMLNGDAHVVIHTADFPEGEIRGMVMLETDINYGAPLDTEQAGIPDTLDMMPLGLSSFNLSLDSTWLEISVLAADLTSPIVNAHLHYGAPGVNGPPVIPLMPYIDGNTFMGVVMLDSLLGDNRDAFIDSLNMGHVYVNIHTENFPGGEIRGKLGRHDGLAYDSWMNVEQQTDPIDPSTPENAMGLMHMYVNEAVDSLEVHFLVDNLSGPVTASHFHMGAAGVPGPVIIPLTGALDGNMAMVTLEALEFSDEMDFYEFLLESIKGNVFINVHTELNPDGEIRGQVMSVSRRGVVFNLCSKQEPGPLSQNPTGQGSGFVTIDRMDKGLHYGIAVSDLTGILTGAHFHQGAIGQPGPVIHSLPTDSVVYGFWNDSTFNAEMVALIEDGLVFANFHTPANPGGELRGQLTLNNICGIPLNVNEYIADEDAVIIYPNPVRSAATLEYSLAQKADVAIRIYDLAGKQVGYIAAGIQNAGDYQQEVDVSRLQDGVYLVSLLIEGTPAAKVKMLINKL